MFIVIEGLDASGKSETSRLLSQRLGAVLYITPPDEYRYIRSEIDNSSRQAQFYYYLSAVHYASWKISELIAQSNTVVCDRYYYSTLSYFSDLPEAVSIDISNLIQPDYAFLLVCEESVRQIRAERRGELSWAELLCAQDDQRIRILRAYEQFGLRLVDTSNAAPQQVVRQILNLVEYPL